MVSVVEFLNRLRIYFLNTPVLCRYGGETPQYCPPPTSLPSGANVKDKTSSGLTTIVLIVAVVFLVRSNVFDI